VLFTYLSLSFINLYSMALYDYFFIVKVCQLFNLSIMNDLFKFVSNLFYFIFIL